MAVNTVTQHSATFQGLPVVAARMQRTEGVDTDYGTVVVAWHDVSRIRLNSNTGARIRPESTGDDTIPRDQVDAVATTPGETVSGPLLAVGDLVLKDGSGRTTTIRNVHVRAEAISVYGDPPDSGVCLLEIGLMDVRGLWVDRGELWGDHNRHEDPQPRPTTTTHLPGMIQLCLNALPGDLTLVHAPTAAYNVYPLALWEGAKPLEVLRDLLRENRLSFVFALDGLRCAVVDTETQTPGPFGAEPAAQVSVPSGGFRYRPGAVRVVGGDVWDELRVDMECVGPSLTGNAILPISEALATYGLSVPEARRWVLLDGQTQAKAFGGKFAPHASRLKSWLFRWWRVPQSLRSRGPFSNKSLAALQGAQLEYDGPVIEAPGWQQVPVSALPSFRYWTAVLDVARVRFRKEYGRVMRDIEAASLIPGNPRMPELQALLDRVVSVARDEINDITAAIATGQNPPSEGRQILQDERLGDQITATEAALAAARAGVESARRTVEDLRARLTEPESR